jgi:proteic killer suppression protein
VEITFANSRLQQTCESEQALKRAFGNDCAKKIMARLSDLRAAQSLEVMRALPGRCHELQGDRSGQLALDVSGGRRLVLEPVGGWPEGKKKGQHVWADIEAVEIVEIADYHG